MDLVDGAWLRANFEPRSWEWIDENHLVCRERSLSKDRERLIAREVIIHAEKGVLVDQFYAERLYDAGQITTLLERAGFRMVRIHDSVRTESSRGQDLGMMAHRIILSALGPAKKSVGASQAVPFANVTVLLGDASLPDTVKLDGQFGELDFDTIERLKKALGKLTAYEYTYLDSHGTLIRSLLNDPPDFVLNLCDEGYRNDPFKELHVPALLELLDIPYTGSAPTCLGLCYNKSQVRAIAEALDIPTPLESYIGPDDSIATLPATFPALVKPNYGDSSVGITENAVVSSKEELLEYIERVRQTMGRIPVLVQEFLTGAEYSVGVLGNPGLTHRVLPILEVDYSALDPELPRILGYESKWVADSAYWNQIRYVEADIPDPVQRRLTDHSVRLFERLGCRDYARFDYRADGNGAIKLLEVNPNPGWCWDGKLNLMAGFAGMTYADLLGEIIEAAQERTQAEAAATVVPASALLVSDVPA
jgi:D-alanine-D-alanine ligase